MEKTVGERRGEIGKEDQKEDNVQEKYGFLKERRIKKSHRTR